MTAASTRWTCCSTWQDVPATVFAAAVPPGNPGLEAEDGLAMVTTHPNGVVGMINHTWTCAKASPIWLSALGTGGALYYEAGPVMGEVGRR